MSNPQTPDPDCYACRLSSGLEQLPGGRLHESDHWLVEHCTGPLGVGTLIVKPKRHCLSVGALTAEESTEMGPLLQRTAWVVQEACQSDQTYVCLWSHAGWRPGQIHFVVQPAWNEKRGSYSGPGPTTQSEMFKANAPLDVSEVERFCDRVRPLFAQRPNA